LGPRKSFLGDSVASRRLSSSKSRLTLAELLRESVNSDVLARLLHSHDGDLRLEKLEKLEKLGRLGRLETE
jgi:hypothetical protein